MQSAPKRDVPDSHERDHQVTIGDHADSETSLSKAGQRRINIVWELTQSVIALAVTGTGMFTASQLALRGDPDANDKSIGITAFLLISNTVFLVIGFYFGRTNHIRTGGVGGEASKAHR